MLTEIFGNRHSILALFFLLIQQLIVASSTIWIADLSGAIINGQDILLYLTLFVSSLFIVYLPGILSSYHLQKAKNIALRNYTSIFVKKYFCIPSFTTDNVVKEDKESWLTSESSRTIEEVFSIGYDAISTTLNTFLNVIALYYVFGAKILIGYVACLITLPLVSKCFQKRLEKNATFFQEDRKSMSQSLLSGWMNITTGNQYNTHIWWKRFLEQWNRADDSSVRAVLFTQFSSISSMVFSLIPVSLNFIWIFFTTQNPVKLAALVATLPRQIQIMQHFEILTTYIMHWHGTYARLKNMLETLIFIPKINQDELLNRMRWDDICFYMNHKTIHFKSFNEFLDFISQLPSGRITIEGKNGSGKTTLINLIKQILGEKAFYLPTHAALTFEHAMDKSLSTGQKMMTHIEEIQTAFPEQQLLLLDEWNANLDLNNAREISAQIDLLAKHKCIVEISHRQDSKEFVNSKTNLGSII